jgi:uncharacterized repeat protein (TIGR01451 family)
MKRKLPFLICLFLVFSLNSISQEIFQWNQRASIPTWGEPGISFSVNGLGYWGQVGGTQSLWAYDPVVNEWTQKQDLPMSSSGMPAFVANNVAYYMPTSDGQIFVYKYNPQLDSWTEVAMFPGMYRGGNFVFAIDSMVYMGLGSDPWGNHLIDVWSFNTNNGQFTQLNNFPFQDRVGASSFVINGKGYMGMGNMNWNFLDPNGKDLYEYDPTLDNWTQKSSIPVSQGRYATTGFGIDNYGYILGGDGTNPTISYDEFWRYDASTDGWIEMPGYGGGGQNYLKSFVIDTVCYAGKGQLWSFSPGCGKVIARVFKDFNQNCAFDTDELVFDNVSVLIEPSGVVLSTNILGEITNCDIQLPDGTYTLHAQSSIADWDLTCQSIDTIQIVNGEILNPVFFGYYSEVSCPSPDITITCPTIRRCSEHVWPIYVYACNENNASGVLENAYALVELDANIIVDPTTTPAYTIENGLYRFEVGNINPGQCVTLVIYANFSCDLQIDETLCMEATLYPVPECYEDTIPEPGPCTEPWDHSSLSVEGECDEDTGIITFTIENGGEAMVCQSEVRVYLDGELYATYYIQLGAESDTTFTFPANGGTWVLQADQHPLHPGNSRPNDHVEGCGDIEGEGDGDDDNGDGDSDDDDEWTPGLVDDLPSGDESPFVDVFCGIVVGSFDPNDKKGFPDGIGEAHETMPNEQLQYLIRFQNTGTAPAYTVVIRDTLDTDLDIFSVTPGASSHEYSFTMYGERVLQWTFNNIMLPDSFSNEEESHGFITYTVNQQPDLEDGTEITNSAAIYFDSNEPVITNTTLHTINHCVFTVINPVVTDMGNGTLTASPANLSYQWIDCATDSPIPGATSNVYNGDNGNYAVQVTTLNACTEQTECAQLVNIRQLNAQMIHVFPIPASQVITAIWEVEGANYTISTPDSRLVLSGRLNKGANSVDISSLATGTYFIKADNFVTRFVVN